MNQCQGSAEDHGAYLQRRLSLTCAIAIALGLMMSGCASPRAVVATPSTETVSSPTLSTPTATGSAAPSVTARPRASPGAATAWPIATAAPSPAASAPAFAATPAGSATPATATSASSRGYLVGEASIGPLTPVERGGPTSTPSPALCTARGLALYDASGQNLITSFSFQPDCTYRVALAPGQYVVKLKPGSFGGSKDLPRPVEIQGGQTTRLDVHIDTGIR